MDLLAALPMAFVMVAGPQIVTAILLATSKRAKLLMGRRAETVLPKVRDWMSSHAWIVNEIVIGLFLVLSVNSLTS